MVDDSSPGQGIDDANRDGIILIVDDEQDILELVSEALSELGGKVVTALNGDIAATILESGVRIDLLFTDIVMPGSLNGLALADRAKRLHPAIKVLYGTGHSGLRVSDETAPVHGEILRKPYRLSDLARRVKALTANDPGGPDRQIGCA
jgi:DNA-binding NtrC family response regulator